MGSTVILLVKIMPSGPEVNLEELKKHIQHAMENEGAKSVTFEEQSLAFGLKALMLNCAFPEEKGTDMVEHLLSSIPHVSSVSIEDYRRAFG